MQGDDAPLEDPDAPAGLGRRGFLQVAAGAPLICTLGGTQVAVRTAGDVERADEAAAAVARPASAEASQAGQEFPQPVPAPGGQVREYWIAARRVSWTVSPSGRDEWMNRRVPRTRFRALVYQLFSAGYARPLGPARMPGPTLYAEVGDVLKVHLRNAGRGQAVTMHPHGLRYNPDYDGSYLGRFTRVGGFVAPGEEFTYLWEATPDTVGVWPYHDHGPNHTLNTLRGLFGAIVIRERGAPAPDVEQVLMLHSLPPQVTGADRVFQTINGRSYAGNTPTVRARAGQDVAFHVMGFDNDFHTFHIHGHRWNDSSGQAVDCPTVGPNETITARFRENNPGRWLYHCHVFTHQTGMAGWYLVNP